MKNLYHSLLLLIAGSTQKELASQIRYLKIENEILRSKLPTRVSVTEHERNRLVKFGSKLGRALNELVTIVHPDTLRRWIREAGNRAKRKLSKVGRPRTKAEIRELIIKFARENDWCYTRIMGELKKLGIKPPSRNTVKNILKEHGLEPGPKRGVGTWDEFLKIHAATLWQCDFYVKRVLTMKGFRDLFLLVFLHVESRRVFIAPSTFHPNEAWVTEQANAFLEHVEETDLGTTIVMHDRDTKFTASFDEVLESADLEVKKAAHRSPNTVAFVERFIQTLQQECLDYFVVFGQQHMDHLVTEMVTHYHEERPHQAKENDPLVPAAPEVRPRSGKRKQRDEASPDMIRVSQIECRQRLGGLLKHYHRKVA
jgi:putative transposase